MGCHWAVTGSRGGLQVFALRPAALGRIGARRPFAAEAEAGRAAKAPQGGGPRSELGLE